MQKSLVAFLVIFGFMCSAGLAADWKCAGASVLKGNEKVTVFYDAESVEFLPDGIVRVWTKSISDSEIELIRKTNEKKIVDKAAEKVVAKQYPPYAIVNSKTNFDSMLDILALEAVANIRETKARASVFFEINCDWKKIRTLAAAVYDKKGVLQGTTKEGDWDYVSPESNGDTLQKILCK